MVYLSYSSNPSTRRNGARCSLVRRRGGSLRESTDGSCRGNGLTSTWLARGRCGSVGQDGRSTRFGSLREREALRLRGLNVLLRWRWSKQLWRWRRSRSLDRKRRGS